MDAVNRVKLARYWQRRGLMMLQRLGADRGGPGFGELARNCFDAARECVRLARVELGMVKRKQYWIVIEGERVAVVSALSAAEARDFYDMTQREMGPCCEVEPCTAYEGRPTTVTGLEYWCEP